MLVVIKPIQNKYRVKRVIVRKYQAVSGKAHAGDDELRKQTLSYAKGEKIDNKVYPHQIAFKMLPYINLFQENSYSGEEMKMIRETTKILDTNIKITCTTVRVPVSSAHSESLNFETEKTFEVDQIKKLMADSPGIVLEDEPEKNIYPLAINAVGKDAVYVGRIRRDFSAENAFNMRCVSDNLRK